MYWCWRAASRAAIVACVALEVDEAHVARALQPLAIGRLQRGAREHGGSPRARIARISSAMRSSHGQRSSSVNGCAGAPSWRRSPAGGNRRHRETRQPERRRERRADRGLARTAHTHQHQDHCVASSKCRRRDDNRAPRRWRTSRRGATDHRIAAPRACHHRGDDMTRAPRASRASAPDPAGRSASAMPYTGSSAAHDRRGGRRACARRLA